MEIRGFRFSGEEAAGAVGDFGTIFPIVLGVAVVANLNLSHIFLFFGIWFIIAALIYRLPIPIEPMKAIGAIVIAEGLSAAEISAAGIMVGALFLALGIGRGMRFVKDHIPTSVIRGVQGGLALLLLRTSFGFAAGDLLFAGIAIGIIVLFFFGARRFSVPDLSAIAVLALGIGAGIYLSGLPEFAPIPPLSLHLPPPEVFLPSAWTLVLPQIPLTLTNAVLATSLLTLDLFRREVDPDRLCRTIGLMNLVSVPLGGFPMCHGAGGLAGQYRFGARTGGADIIAGIILLGFAFFFATPAMLSIIPMGIFGALLVFVAIELARHSIRTDSYAVTGVIALSTPFIGITFAFIAGFVLAYVMKKRIEKSEES